MGLEVRRSHLQGDTSYFSQIKEQVGPGRPTDLQQLIRQPPADQPVVQSGMEQLALARERQLISMGPHDLWIVWLASTRSPRRSGARLRSVEVTRGLDRNLFAELPELITTDIEG